MGSSVNRWANPGLCWRSAVAHATADSASECWYRCSSLWCSSTQRDASLVASSGTIDAASWVLLCCCRSESIIELQGLDLSCDYYTWAAMMIGLELTWAAQMIGLELQGYKRMARGDCTGENGINRGNCRILIGRLWKVPPLPYTLGLRLHFFGKKI